MFPKMTYVCAPFRATGDNPEEEFAENLERTKRACRTLALKGIPVMCPQLMYSQFLREDSELERDMGRKMGKWLLENACDEMVVVGSRITEGMAYEIGVAKDRGIRIFVIPDPITPEERLLNAILKERG